MGLLERLRGRRQGAELEPVRAALAVLRAAGIEARLLDASAAWEALQRAGVACVCVLAPELRRDEQGGLGWPLLLRFSPGSEFAHLSEWRPLAERIVDLPPQRRTPARSDATDSTKPGDTPELDDSQRLRARPSGRPLLACPSSPGSAA